MDKGILQRLETVLQCEFNESLLQLQLGIETMDLDEVTVLIPNDCLLYLSGDQFLSLLVVTHPHEPPNLVESSQVLQGMTIVVAEGAVHINVCLQRILRYLLERRC